jgi:hypothetical protein
MDDARGMPGGERIRNLDRVLEDLTYAQALARDDLFQRVTLHVLHYQVIDLAFNADVVDGDDIRVVESRGRARLLEKTLLADWIGKPVRRQQLDGDYPTQPCVTAPIDFAHSAGAEGLQDLVRAQLRSTIEDHSRISFGLASTDQAIVLRASDGREGSLRTPVSNFPQAVYG